MASSSIFEAFRSWILLIYKEYYPYSLFTFLFIAVLSASLLSLVEDGLFITDEVFYFLSAKSLAETGSFEIWNGLDEFVHPALQFNDIALVYTLNGRIFEVYPPLYAFMAYPFYRVFGFHGLFIINVVAFSVSMVLVYLIARRVFGDILLASSSVVAFSLFTFALGFSIDLWPHMLSVSLVLLSFYCALFFGRSGAFFIASGFVSGLAIGVRYQDIVFSLVLLAYILLRHGFRNLSYFLTGLSVPLFVIVALNYSMFGAFSTGYSGLFSSFFGGYSYFYFVLFCSLLFLMWVCYPKALSMAGNARTVITVYAILLFAMFVFFQLCDPLWAERFVLSVRVAYSEVVDMSSFPAAPVEPGKQSLLQASPFLALALFGFVGIFYSRNRSDVLYLFTAFSIVEILFFSAVVQQHGEDTQNMRFFLESVPFLAVFSACALRDLMGLKGIGLRVFLLLFMGFLSLFLIVNGQQLLLPFIRKFTLVLAAYVMIFYVIQVRFRGFRNLYAFLVAAVLACSFFVGIADMGISQTSRGVFHDLDESICPHLAQESVMLSYGHRGLVPIAPTRLCSHVRFAVVNPNQTAEIVGLVDFYVRRNVSVYILDDGSYAEWTSFAERMRSQYKSRAFFIQKDILTELYS